MRAIGLMSGTSMDGIDVALLDTDGEAALRFGPSDGFPYAEADRALLRAALAAATVLTDRAARPQPLAEAERRLTALHAEAVENFLDRHAIDRAGVDLVGFHGQTVLHRPEARLTVQIGDAGALADRLGLPVVADLRAADV
ncbi:anhydro-N-acetylmuramic acid kinase, partial [Lichenihabitans sp. Uapishka_5]|uniref:anhydro-N-acetylmuramic acid kinase n=1 Tax=Lichenihabitans sp. Uapishka_5 TaxID=3037302 RepID=UPI0029E80B5D